MVLVTLEAIVAKHHCAGNVQNEIKTSSTAIHSDRSVRPRWLPSRPTSLFRPSHHLEPNLISSQKPGHERRLVTRVNRRTLDGVPALASATLSIPRWSS